MTVKSKAAHEAATKLSIIKSEVKDKEGRWYSVRIRPYRTIENKIDGAIISLIDIDAIKRSREEVQGVLCYTQAIIDTMRESLVVLDKDVRIVSANKSFYDMFKLGASEVKGKPTVIVAHTVKGKGVSFIENKAEWHGIAPKKEEYERAVKELDAQLSKIV